MRVILVNPSRAGRGNLPINLPLLQAVLKRAGHEVRIFDFTDFACFQPERLAATGASVPGQAGKWSNPGLYFKPAVLAVPPTLADERRAHFRRYGEARWARRAGGLLAAGDPAEEFGELCRSFAPHVVGVSAMTVDFPAAMRFLAPHKERHRFKCLVGGVHAISMPEHAVADPVADGACVGEGETPFLEYLARLADSGDELATPGLWFRTGGEIRRNPAAPAELEALPFLDFEGFDPAHFYRPFDGRSYRMLNYTWARGCPYACTYCINAIRERAGGTAHGVRRPSIDRCITELTHLVDTHHFSFVRFWDEDFTAVRTDLLAALAARYRAEVALPFLVYARAESVTEEKVRILRDMGCVTVAMGIESGSEEIRRRVLNRQVSDRTLIETFELIHAYGIRTSAYNILGLPGEDRERVFATITLNRAIPAATSSCTLLEPYPNTPIRKRCEDEGLPVEQYPSYDGFLGLPQFVPRGMTREELVGLFRTFTLYVSLPRSLFPRIRLAEADTPEGRAVFAELATLKAERYPEKPWYREELAAAEALSQAGAADGTGRPAAAKA